MTAVAHMIAHHIRQGTAAEPLNVVFMALSSPSVPLVFAPSISNERSECIDGHIHTLGSCFLAFVGHWG